MQHTANPWPNSYAPSNVPVSPGVFNCPERPPVSTAMYGTTSTFSWAHTVPSLMPWGAKGGEDVVHFTAPFPPDPCTSQTATSWELLNNFAPNNNTNANVHLKRKSDLPEAIPQKICITEEKMAARFREMHISNQYSVPEESTPFGPYATTTPECDLVGKNVTNIKDLDFILKGSDSDALTSSKSLVLAPEIKKLVEPDKIFASTFLNKVERPTMALVVWQPQSEILQRNENSVEDDNPSEEENSNAFLPQQHTSVCSQGLLPGLPTNSEVSELDEEEMDA